MGSIYELAGRRGFYAQISIRGRIRKLWLGPVAKSQAAAVANHLERLKVSAETGTVPPADCARWARSVGPRIRGRLAAWGLIDPAAAAVAEIPRSLAGYAAFYLAGRQDTKPTTRRRWANVAAKLIEYWPPAVAVAAITPGDCDRFAAGLRRQFSPSHSGKLLADSRQLFEAAKRDRVIESNPLEGIDCGGRHDRTRETYVTPEAAAALITAADPFYAALIAAARFGGLRVPSEPLALRWSHVDWAAGRIHLPQCKTAARVVPLFPELRPHLAALFEIAAPGSDLVFGRARGSAGTVWRKSLFRLIDRTGGRPWPKLWQNLRASCQTDLQTQFPEAVVNYWIGHNQQTGRKHYLRINDSHYNAAAGMVAGMVALPTLPDTPRQLAAGSSTNTPQKSTSGLTPCRSQTPPA